MLDLKRQQMLLRQEALVQALVGNGCPPPGFVPERMALARRGLARKRHQEALHSWQGLERRIGPAIHGLFEEYAGAHRRPPGGSPVVDGYRFAGWLAAQGDQAGQAVIANFREGRLGVEARGGLARQVVNVYFWLLMRTRLGQTGPVGKLVGPAG